MNDKQLKQQFLNREDSAVASLAETYGKKLYSLAMNLLGSARDAQECVNDTYLAIWNAIPPADPEPLCAYLYQTCRNIAAKRRRNDTAQKRCTASDVSLEELAGCIGSDDLIQKLDEKLLGQAIDRFLATLSQENRLLFLRRYWYGDSVRQLALRMGMQENAVSVRLSRIRTKLKTYLIREGILP